MDYLVTVLKKSNFSNESIFTHRLICPTDGYMNGFVKALELAYPGNIVTCNEIV